MGAETDLGLGVRAAAERVLEVVPDARAPLGLDSLATAELAFELERRFQVRLDDDVRFESLEDATARVLAAAEGRAATEPLRRGIGHLQWFAVATVCRALAGYYRLEVEGVDHLPAEGPAIIAMNHDSLLDIPLLGVAVPRRVWAMGKVELFRSRPSRWLFHVLGAFPVHRGRTDLLAIRAALEVIRRGRLLAMYPEGTRAPSLQPFTAGAAWVALATGAPLVPTGITGTGEAMPKGARLPRRTRVRIRFGEPVHPGIEDDPVRRLRRAREVTEELRGRVGALLATPERRGAGHRRTRR